MNAEGLLVGLIDVALKTSLAVLLVWLGATLLRATTPALRTRLWSLAIGSVLLFPLASLTVSHLNARAEARGGATVVPSLGIPGWPTLSRAEEGAALLADVEPDTSIAPLLTDQARPVSEARAAAFPLQREDRPSGPTTRMPRFDPALALLAIWVAGFLALALRQLFVTRRELSRPREIVTSPRLLRAIHRIAADSKLGRSPRLHHCQDDESPAVLGWWRPRILLPREAHSWSSARLHATLTHELEHVRRHDVLTRQLARLACALQWPNPLVWLALRKLRFEQESACDAAVLRSGASATDYARHLVDAARALRDNASPRPTYAFVQLTRKTTLEARLMRILATKSSRPKRTLSLVTIGLLAIALPALALLGPGGQESSTPVPDDVGEIVRQLHQVELQMEELEVVAEEIEAEIEPFEVEMEQAEARFEPSEAELEQLEEAFAPYEEQLEALATELAPFEEKLQAIELEMEQVELQAEEIEAALAPFEQELEALEEAHAPMEAEMEALEERMEPIAEELDHLAEKLQEAHDRHEDGDASAEAEMQRLQQSMQEVQDRLAPLHNEMRSFAETRSHEAIREVMERMEPELEKMRGIHEQMRPYHDRMRAVHDEMQPTLERMKNLHQEMRPLHEDLAKRHEGLRPMHDAMRAIHEKMQPSLEKMRELQGQMEPLARRHRDLARALHAELEGTIEATLESTLGSLDAEQLRRATKATLRAADFDSHDGALTIDGDAEEIADALQEAIGLDDEAASRAAAALIQALEARIAR